MIEYSIVRLSLVRGSETLVSLMGMTSVVSSASHYLGLVFQVLVRSS
jgi:hypothetical protein